MTKTATASRVLVCGLSLALTAYAQCPPPGGYGSPTLGPNNGPVTGSSGTPSTPSAGSPSTPRPAGPTTPGPGGPTSNGPITPRVGAPVGRAAGPRTGGRGMPISLERGATSKNRLKVDWVHPVPPERSQTETAAVGPLALEAALAELWESDDGRPLLVLRECRLCQGSDGALLNRSLANDKTMLMTKWFRTVKLPAHVAEAGHPFHNVFGGYDFKDGWPHFFLLAHPGAEPVAFNGQQTQSQLWRGMFGVLEQRYAKSPQKAIKQWLSLLDRYDTIDSRERQMKEELLAVRADQGPDSSRAKKLSSQLAEMAEERAEIEQQELKVQDLGLLDMPKKLAAR